MYRKAVVERKIRAVIEFMHISAAEECGDGRVVERL